MITPKKCAEILNRWEINWTPEYRGFTCAGCLKKIRKAWHIHFMEDGYKREFHLCKKCGKKYNL